MKLTILAMSLLILTMSQSFSETCSEKISDIETKISMAKKNGNKNQISGLEKALAETKSNCTEGKLLGAQQDKIKSKEKDLIDATEELNTARAENKSAKKIQEKQNKVNEKTKELEELKLVK